MKIIDISNRSFSNDRAEFRSELINLFLDEEPGTGKGEFCTKYKYIVNKIDGSDIFLQRPAQFNNGFDFTLNVSGINFNPQGRQTTKPTHNNIVKDLTIKKEEDNAKYLKLREQIDKIYRCSHETNSGIVFKEGMKTQILLECIRWLFAEQDVTYWNYSGRGMFYNEILNVDKL